MRIAFLAALLAALSAPAAHAAEVRTTLRIERGHLSMTLPRSDLRISSPATARAAQVGRTAITVSDRRT